MVRVRLQSAMSLELLSVSEVEIEWLLINY